MDDYHVGAILISCGILFISLGFPLRRGLVPMNKIYGVRFRQAFTSERLWDEINRFGGAQLTLAGGVLVLLGALALVLAPPLSSPLAIFFLLAVPAAGLAGALVSYRYARGLAEKELAEKEVAEKERTEDRS